MDEKVIVESMTSGQICIDVPELRFNKLWPAKGAKMPLSKDLLREIIYDPGVDYMFRNGMLAINDDNDFCVELGLIEEADKPMQQVTSKYMERVLKLMPKNDMKKALEEMSPEQKQEFVDYTICQKDVNLDRIEIINKVCNVNILNLIKLKKQREE